MKTKIYIPLLFLSILWIENTEAGWYNYPGNTITISWTRTWCTEDGEVDSFPNALPVSPDAAAPLPGDTGGRYFVYNSPAPGLPWWQARVTARPTATTITCQRWDSTRPTFSATAWSSTWINSTWTSTITASDGLWSGINAGTLKFIWDNANCTWAWAAFTNGQTIPVSNVGDHTLYLCGTDNASNTYTQSFGPYRYDPNPPSATSISYFNGWSNATTVNITMNASDGAGESGISRYRVEYMYSDNNPTFAGGWTSWTSVGPDISSTATSYVYPFNTIASSAGRAYRFRFRVRDTAGNWSTWTENSALTYKLDTVVPNPTLFNPTAPTPNNGPLIAKTNQNFTFNYTGNGSPIGVSGNFENNANPAATDPITIAVWVYAINNRNISNVSTDIGANGWRQITYTITTIFDEAGNSAAAAQTYTWYVYADKDNATTLPGTFGGPYVADGQARSWNIVLRDQFNNPVIPASGITRVVNLNLTNVTNTMFLNQYLRNSVAATTSVYVSTPPSGDTPLTFAASQSLGSQTSTNGTYTINVKAYTPTANSYGTYVSDPTAAFSFEPSFTITDTLSWPMVTPANASPVFIFRPLFTTVITGDLVDGGFIEWVEQGSSVQVIQDPASSPNPISAAALSLQFSGSLASVSSFDFYANSTTPTSAFPHGTLTSFTVTPTFPGSTNLNSRLAQKLTTVVAKTFDLSLSTHVSYTLDSKPIVTNSFVVGRNAYYTASSGNVWSQVGVRVLGSLSSQYIRDIITSQFTTGVSMFGKINRWEIREAVKKNVALAIRNATLTPIVSTISSFSALPSAGVGANGVFISRGANKSILYIEKTWGNVILNAGSISGVRTIVVKWANLYIQSNMSYASNDSILGVIVQKDSAGNGGNLYIDPAITNLVGSYVIDGSIISYNGTTELGYNANIDDLKNQLYLLGSITSENTIGGSKLNPPKCPSLVTICSNPATMAEAQKYDLNYLRRYYLYNNAPFGNGKIIGNETCTSVSCSTTSTLPQKFISTSDELAQYPFIIEFNSNLLRVQPIGFESIIE